MFLDSNVLWQQSHFVDPVELAHAFTCMGFDAPFQYFGVRKQHVKIFDRFYPGANHNR